jgi:hypothetical protein
VLAALKSDVLESIMSELRHISGARRQSACGVRLTALCLAIVVSIAGCATWSPVERERIPAAIARQPGRVRVSSQGVTFELKGPVLASDTLRAATGGSAASIHEIDSLWVRQADRKKTRAVAFATLALALTFVVAASAVTGGRNIP